MRVKGFQIGFFALGLAWIFASCHPHDVSTFMQSQPPALFSKIRKPTKKVTATKKDKKCDDNRWKYYFLKDLLSRRPPNKKRRYRQFIRIGVCVTGSMLVAAVSVAVLEWALAWCTREQEQAFERQCAQRAEFLQRYRDLLVPIQSYYEQMDSRLCALQRQAGSNGFGGANSVRVRPRVQVNVRVGGSDFVSSGALRERVQALRRRVKEGSDAGWRPTLVFVGVFLGALGVSSYVSREQSTYFKDVLEYAVSLWPAYKDCIPEEFHGEFERLKEVVDCGGGVDEERARRVIDKVDKMLIMRVAK